MHGHDLIERRSYRREIWEREREREQNKQPPDPVLFGARVSCRTYFIKRTRCRVRPTEAPGGNRRSSSPVVARPRHCDRYAIYCVFYQVYFPRTVVNYYCQHGEKAVRWRRGALWSTCILFYFVAMRRPRCAGRYIFPNARTTITKSSRTKIDRINARLKTMARSDSNSFRVRIAQLVGKNIKTSGKI